MLKVLTNSIYGVLGYNKFGLYDPRLAKSITQTGRYLTKKLIAIASRYGEVIYGDTDSVFVKTKTPEELESKMNEELKGLSGDLNCKENFFQVKFEKRYKRFLIVSKKKYAGQREDEEIEIKGFECIRSDHSEYSRRLQRELICWLVRFGKEKMNFCFPKSGADIQHVPLTNLAVPKKLDKELNAYKTLPIHIRAAKNSGKNIIRGDTILFLNLKKGDVIALNDMEDLEIERLKDKVDYDYIFENTIKHKIEGILGVL